LRRSGRKRPNSDSGKLNANENQPREICGSLLFPFDFQIDGCPPDRVVGDVFTSLPHAFRATTTSLLALWSYSAPARSP